MNTPRDDEEQMEYIRNWRNKRGCWHWLITLALGVAAAVMLLAK